MVQPTPPALPHAASSKEDPLLGRVISDRFKILSVLARGGMGKVYRAEQSPLGRVVALKVLQPNYAGENEPEFHKRFFMEASIVARLTHPNTVTVYDYGQTTDGVYFMAMELLEGKTLHRLIREAAPMEPLRALHILVQACRSLREAHGHGVIHRDLKPANLFLIRHDDDPDFVKVLDFGLVKRTDENAEEALTQTGLFMGSPKYMAPEQIRGERVSPATDVYSLGVILYEMLTGKVPFERASSVNLLMAHVSDPVPAMTEINPTLAIPPQVEELASRCLHKRPEERFATMDELIAAIKRVGNSLGQSMPSLTGEFAPSRLLHSGETAVPTSITPPPMPAGASRESSLSPTLSSMSGSVPVPSTPSVAPGRAKVNALLAGLGVLVVGLAVALVVTRTTARPTEVRETQAPVTATVSLDSVPSGATVREGDAVLGTTPLRLTWSGAMADPRRMHTFTFQARGFDATSITLAGASMQHTAQLAPHPEEVVIPPPMILDAGAPVGVVRPVRPVVRGGSHTGSVGAHAPSRAPTGPTPSGYREDPYN